MKNDKKKLKKMIVWQDFSILRSRKARGVHIEEITGARFTFQQCLKLKIWNIEERVS